MSYNGIGLQTTRGSGTNGYVQGNKFHRSASRLQRQEWRDLKSIHGAGAGASKKPDEAILEHNRKREIEAKLMQLEDDLEEKGVGAEEIAAKLAEARARFEREAERARSKAGRYDDDDDDDDDARGISDARVFSRRHRPRAPRDRADRALPPLRSDDTHAIAQRKAEKMDSLRRAFGFKEDRDAREGDAFDQDLQLKLKQQRRLEHEEAARAKEEARLKENRRREKEKKRQRKEREEAERVRAKAEKRALKERRRLEKAGVAPPPPPPPQPKEDRLGGDLDPEERRRAELDAEMDAFAARGAAKARTKGGERDGARRSRSRSRS